MLSALLHTSDPVLAMEANWEDGPFFCPACQEALILKQGSRKIAHFAHQPKSICAYSGDGESEAHQQAKLSLYQSLFRAPGVSSVRMEHCLQQVRSDISFCFHGQAVAIEIQLSTLSPEEIEQRTLAYSNRNIAVLWLSLLEPEVLEEDRYAPKAWQRYLHALYYGRLYLWEERLELQPVKFEEYMLPAGRYSDERRSKRFVTPEILPTCSILDLAPVWRKPWRAFPRALLWTARF